MSSEFPASGTARAGRGEQGTMLGDRERLVAVGGERVAPRVYLLAESEKTAGAQLRCVARFAVVERYGFCVDAHTHVTMSVACAHASY
jgi:hypothetical protein